LSFFDATDLFKARTGAPPVSDQLLHNTVRKLLGHSGHTIVRDEPGFSLLHRPDLPKILGQSQATIFPTSGHDRVHGIEPHTIEVPFKNQAGEGRKAHVSISSARQLGMMPTGDPNELPVNAMHAYMPNVRDEYGRHHAHIHHIVLHVPVHDSSHVALAHHVTRATGLGGFNDYLHGTAPSKERLAQAMRSSLGHEFSHAMDPGIEAFHASVERKNPGGHNASMRSTRQNQFLGQKYPDLHELMEHPDLHTPGSATHTEQARRWRGYINHPAEIPAWLHQAHREMTTREAVHAAKTNTDYHGGDGPIRHMRDFSPTWNTVHDELKPTNRKRFLKMAAATHAGIHSGDISGIVKSIREGTL